jgi:hypothetical protein
VANNTAPDNKPVVWFFNKAKAMPKCQIIQAQLDLCQVKLMGCMELMDVFERLHMHQSKAYSLLYWVQPSADKH